MCKGLFCIIETGVGDTACSGLYSDIFWRDRMLFHSDQIRSVKEIMSWSGSPSEILYITCTPQSTPLNQSRTKVVKARALKILPL